MAFLIIFSSVSAILHNLSGWALDTWAELSIDEIIFHLKVPIEGTNEDLILDAIRVCLPTGILVFLFVLMIGIYIGKRKNHQLFQ